MGERRPLDAYYTPDPLARAIVRWAAERIPAPRRIVEPSVGGGAFVRACREEWRAPNIHGVDLDPSAAGLDLVTTRHVGDYLDAPLGDADLTIGNPPFARPTGRVSARTGKPIMEPIWHRHVERALESSAHVVMLLRLAAVEGIERAAWWRARQPSEVAVLPRRPSFTGGGTDSCAYGVFWWSEEHTVARPATMSWLEWAP